MAEPRLQGDGPETKRRKVRKGTQNCWECRRRKVRCTFATPTNPICDNCRRRGTACIGQEYPDSPIRSASGHQVDARLGRVEDLIQQLVGNVSTVHVPKSPPQDLSKPQSTLIGLEDRGEQQSEPRLLESCTSNRCTGLATPATFEVGATASHGRERPQQSGHIFDHGKFTRSEHLERPSPATTNSQIQNTRAASKYEELIRTLIAAWPSQHDLDIIYILPVGLSAHLYSVVCTSYSGSMDPDPPSPQDILQLPPPGSHPVLIARKLLVLGTFLQGVPTSSMQDLASLSISYRDIMDRVVDTAIRLVTTNDDLVRSVEGIECIMIEAFYQNFAGNLHQAWMAVRRGIAIAQMMALHRGLSSPSLKILEPQTRATFNPDHMCFRLLEMDRYLSLMLGLPQASPESRFATPKALKGCHPIDRMERLHCAVAGRILQRNDADAINLAEIQEIDKLLQKAAAEVPPQWWLIPNFTFSDSDNAEIFRETSRLMDQLAHHFLLIRLHLPYMLRSSPDHRHDHSKITAVNASRECLTRFVAYRKSDSSIFYCRGCDFLAFTATTVLCVAHIDSRSQRQGHTENPDPGSVFNFLAHSRPSDRGIMECTLEIFESMARIGPDVIASKLARIVHHLLDIEANAAEGTRYTTNLLKGNEEEQAFCGKLANGGKALHVYLPYLGAINFQRGTISKSAPMAPTPPSSGSLTTSATNILLYDQLDQQNQPLPSRGDYRQTSQISSSSGYSNSQTVPLQFGLPPLPQNPLYETSEATINNSGNTQNAQLPVPEGIASLEDDWDLQGIDIALFDSLFSGTAIPDAVEEETWAQWANNE